MMGYTDSEGEPICCPCYEGRQFKCEACILSSDAGKGHSSRCEHGDCPFRVGVRTGRLFVRPTKPAVVPVGRFDG